MTINCAKLGWCRSVVTYRVCLTRSRWLGAGCVLQSWQYVPCERGRGRWRQTVELRHGHLRQNTGGTCSTICTRTRTRTQIHVRTVLLSFIHLHVLTSNVHVQMKFLVSQTRIVTRDVSWLRQYALAYPINSSDFFACEVALAGRISQF